MDEPISDEALAALRALLVRLDAAEADRDQLAEQVEARNRVINHWVAPLGYATANEMAYPAVGDRRARPALALAERDALLARVEQLEAALRWYAEPEHYEQYSHLGTYGDPTSEANNDAGERARAALAAVEPAG